jgi:PAS domain S-box-containing protein
MARLLEDSLYASEHRMRQILDGLFGFVGLYALDGTLIDANEAPLRAAGLQRDEVLGRPFWDTYWWNYDDGVQAELKSALMKAARGEVVRYEPNVRVLGGALITIDVTFSPLRNSAGEITHILGFGVDISDRKRAEHALRASEARLNEAQRIAGIGSWELDITTSTLTWSDEIFRIFEIDPEQFGASYEAFLNTIHPEDRETVNATYTSSVETHQPYNIVHRLQMEDGRIKFVRERCETHYDAAGRPVRSVGTVQDVTERKHDEDKVKASETRFRVLVENATDSIFLHAPGGAILDVNPRACESLGYTRDEMIGMSVMTFDPFVKPDMLARIVEQLDAGQPVAFDTSHRRKDGSTFPVEVRLNPFHMNDQRVALSVVRDITERKRTEEILHSSIAEKETLLREVHHRVKNNLQIISSLLYFQGRKVKDPTALAVFGEASDRVRSMILVHEKLSELSG